MTTIFNFLTPIIMPIITLYIGYHLSKRNDDKEIILKRFELYKPLYFKLCVGKLDLEETKSEINYLHNQIIKNMNDYLLLDSKTRKYLENLCFNRKTKKWDKRIMEKWNNIDKFLTKTKKLRKSIQKEFTKIQYILGYPVSPIKYTIANTSSMIAIVAFSCILNIGSFSVYVGNDINIVNMYLIICISILIASIGVCIRFRHYITNY